MASLNRPIPGLVSFSQPLSPCAPLTQRSTVHDSNAPERSPAPDESWAMVTPLTLFSAVRSRLPSVLLTAGIVLAVVLVILLAMPSRYASDGLLYVQLGRDALSVDPTAKNSGVQGISLQETRSAEVVSIGQMIGSREIAQRVVDAVGAKTINQPRGWLEKGKHQIKGWLPEKSKFPIELTAEEYTAQMDREEAIKKVRDWLEVEIPDEGYTLAVRTDGPEPFLSQAITQAVMDQYRSYHVEAHGSEGSLQFFEEQVAASRESATEARQKLQRTRSKMGWMSIESAESALRDRIVALEVSLDEARGQCAQIRESHRCACRATRVDQGVDSNGSHERHCQRGGRRHADATVRRGSQRE